VPLATPSLTVADTGNSGGYTATVTGGDPAATNTLTRQAVTGVMGAGTFTSSGTRTGPGAIAGTAAKGMFWWKLSSTLSGETVVAPLVLQNLTDANGAVADRILDATVARMKLCALPDIGNEVGREIVPSDRNESNPSVRLSQFLQTDQERFGTLTDYDDVAYAVRVEIAATDAYGDDDGRVQLWRQMIGRAFRRQRLSGVSEVRTCFVEPDYTVSQDQAIGSAARSKMWATSILVLRFVAEEPRGLGA
jgi:hypothetical protein